MTTVEVSVLNKTYPITIGRNLMASIRAFMDEHHLGSENAAVITDESVMAHQTDWMDAAFGGLPRLVLPAGERTKSFHSLERCCDFFALNKLDRQAVIFCVGGGVIGDLGGYAAASYLRGIRFVQVPTTLLAMVDSSVGGKTGINLKSGKNLVGAFHQPEAVFADLDLLKSLPAREFSAGMAEVIKHGLLARASLFELLENEDALTASANLLEQVVAENCRIKSAVVQADEKELAKDGGRALLNLGHTFGHAIESASGYTTYVHGEAVGIGLLLATQLSVKWLNLQKESVNRVLSVLNKYQLPTQLKESLPIELLEEKMLRDKKVRDGKLRFVLLVSIGKSVTKEGIPFSETIPLWVSVGAADS